MQREHIGEDRLEQCAIAATDLTEAENVHLEDCANCWKRLVVAVQLAVPKQRAEMASHLVM